jgi:hypothetical protein
MENRGLHGCDDGILTILGTTRIEFLHRRVPSPLAVNVYTEALGDHAQPREESALAGQGRQGAKCPGEGLLGCIFRSRRVTQAAETRTVQPLEVAAVQLGESCLVATLESLDQDSIGLEVDTVHIPCAVGRIAPLGGRGAGRPPRRRW